jgi:hypothetical protein
VSGLYITKVTIRVCRRDDDIAGVDSDSGALAADCPRITPAYEDGNGRTHSAAVSSDCGTSIPA